MPAHCYRSYTDEAVGEYDDKGAKENELEYKVLWNRNVETEIIVEEEDIEDKYEATDLLCVD